MKIYNKENIKHGTKDFPIALYKIKTTKDMEILQYFHWHNEYEIFVIDNGGELNSESYIFTVTNKFI